MRLQVLPAFISALLVLVLVAVPVLSHAFSYGEEVVAVCPFGVATRHSFIFMDGFRVYLGLVDSCACGDGYAACIGGGRYHILYYNDTVVESGVLSGGCVEAGPGFVCADGSRYVLVLGASAYRVLMPVRVERVDGATLVDGVPFIVVNEGGSCVVAAPWAVFAFNGTCSVHGDRLYVVEGYSLRVYKLPWLKLVAVVNVPSPGLVVCDAGGVYWLYSGGAVYSTGGSLLDGYKPVSWCLVCSEAVCVDLRSGALLPPGSRVYGPFYVVGGRVEPIEPVVSVLDTRASGMVCSQGYCIHVEAGPGPVKLPARGYTVFSPPRPVEPARAERVEAPPAPNVYVGSIGAVYHKRVDFDWCASALGTVVCQGRGAVYELVGSSLVELAPGSYTWACPGPETVALVNGTTAYIYTLDGRLTAVIENVEIRRGDRCLADGHRVIVLRGGLVEVYEPGGVHYTTVAYTGSFTASLAYGEVPEVNGVRGWPPGYNGAAIRESSVSAPGYTVYFDLGEVEEIHQYDACRYIVEVEDVGEYIIDVCRPVSYSVVDVEPDTARVVVGPGVAFEGDVLVETVKPVRVHVEAPGYKPVEVTVRPGANATVALERVTVAVRLCVEGADNVTLHVESSSVNTTIPNCGEVVVPQGERLIVETIPEVCEPVEVTALASGAVRLHCRQIATLLRVECNVDCVACAGGKCGDTLLLPAGRVYTLVVKPAAPGYLPVNVTVNASKPVMTLKVKLPRAPRLELVSTPSHARITVHCGGEAVTAASGAVLTLKPGRCIVRAEAPGYKPYETVVELHPDDYKRLVIVLERVEGEEHGGPAIPYHLAAGAAAAAAAAAVFIVARRRRGAGGRMVRLAALILPILIAAAAVAAAERQAYPVVADGEPLAFCYPWLATTTGVYNVATHEKLVDGPVVSAWCGNGTLVVQKDSLCLVCRGGECSTYGGVCTPGPRYIIVSGVLVDTVSGSVEPTRPPCNETLAVLGWSEPVYVCSDGVYTGGSLYKLDGVCVAGTRVYGVNGSRVYELSGHELVEVAVLPANASRIACNPLYAVVETPRGVYAVSRGMVRLLGSGRVNGFGVEAGGYTVTPWGLVPGEPVARVGRVTLTYVDGRVVVAPGEARLRVEEPGWRTVILDGLVLRLYFPEPGVYALPAPPAYTGGPGGPPPAFATVKVVIPERRYPLVSVPVTRVFDACCGAVLAYDGSNALIVSPRGVLAKIRGYYVSGALGDGVAALSDGSIIYVYTWNGTLLYAIESSCEPVHAYRDHVIVECNGAYVELWRGGGAAPTEPLVESCGILYDVAEHRAVYGVFTVEGVEAVGCGAVLARDEYYALDLGVKYVVSAPANHTLYPVDGRHVALFDGKRLEIVYIGSRATGVRIITDPDAKVYVNNVYVGTGSLFYAAPPGAVLHIRVEKRWCRPAEATVRVPDGVATIELHPEPLRVNLTVFLESPWPGIRIERLVAYVDGERVEDGNPLRFTVRYGPIHNITVYDVYPGVCAPVEVKSRFKPGDVVLRYTCKPRKSGLLAVTRVPVTVRVLAPGYTTTRNVTRLAFIPLKPGNYTVESRALVEGYGVLKLNVTIPPGGVRVVNVTPPRLATLIVTVVPRDARIIVSGPEKLEARGVLNARLQPGNYSILATAPGYKPYATRVSLAPGEVKRINIVLEPVERVEEKTAKSSLESLVEALETHWYAAAAVAAAAAIGFALRRRRRAPRVGGA